MANAGIFATSGSKLYIGGPKTAQAADFVVGDFSSQSWVEISWMESIGQFGDESAEITFDAIGQQRTFKLKGNRNAGNLEAVCAIDYLDEGQQNVVLGEKTTFDYAFKVEFNDEPSAVGTPSIRYFIAKIMTAREMLDGANNIMKMSMRLGINSNVVRVDAA